VNDIAHRFQFGSAIRKCLTGLALCGAAAAMLDNVVNYRQILQQREGEADAVAASLPGLKKQGANTDALLRLNFYTLLERLGRDPALHHGDTGVFVADPAFFQGAYIDRPADTVLDRCAIQPFSIPALTGMPLVAGLRERQNGCKYESYAYQYLPPREFSDPAILSQPCALAQMRGLQYVVVIDRKNTDFTTMRLDCARH
jgi:hypothetical protein